jgi:radical SAM protein with 4Fe4S-binding SPASM domain
MGKMGLATAKHIVRYIDEKILKYQIFKILHKPYYENLVHIDLDISGTCNLNCRMCSLKKWYARDTSKKISHEILVKLESVFSRIHSIDLQCNCEPLLHPDIVDIIKYIKRRSPQIFVSLVTNGTLLNSSLSYQLIESGLDRIGFSIDGACAETYQKIREGARFERVLHNIREFTAIKKSMSSTTPQVDFITVASRENIRELSQILKLGIDLEIDSFSVNGLEPYTEEMSKMILYDGNQTAKYQAIWKKLQEIAIEQGIQILLPSLAVQQYTSCKLTSCVIDVAGNVYPCPVLSYERPYYYFGEKFVHPQISFGNLDNQSFFEIWNAKPYKRFRKNVLQGKFPDYCQTCLMNHKVICPI